MTLIANWVAMDDNKVGKLPSSLYLATDSRITYLDGGGNILCHEDHTQKIFISSKYPEMFAICGDYKNCASFIENLIRKIDDGIMDMSGYSIEEKISCIKEYFFTKSKSLKCESIILYGTKVGIKLYLYRFALTIDSVAANCVPLGKQSQVISRDGSGENDFYEKWLEFNSNARAFNEAETSRGAFRCIYEAIEKTNDSFVGGKMQAAVLYRGHEIPHPIGIYYGNDCYLFGEKYTPAKNDSIIEYRNLNFEISTVALIIRH